MPTVRKFTLKLWPTVLTTIMMVVLLGLGTWQVQRLHWKEKLIRTIELQSHSRPIAMQSLSGIGDFNYMHGVANGVFLNEKTFYLLETSLNGDGGYHVLTPMKLTDGRYLLVDRGWVPYDHRQQNVGYTLPQGQMTVMGTLRRPEHFWMETTNDPIKNNWYWIDLIAMAKNAELPFLLPYVLEADATPNPGGYPIGGQTKLALPNNHLIYAITWYGLALVLLVVYGVSSYRRKP